VGYQDAIGKLAEAHHLTGEEVSRLGAVLVTWPSDLWGRGLSEEVENILAARELSRVPPLTMDDIRAIQDIWG
jgi:hypothetical protein